MNTRLGLALLGAASAGVWAVWPVARRQQTSSVEALPYLEPRARVVPRTEPVTGSAPSAPVMPPPTASALPTLHTPPADDAAAPPKSSAELEADYEARFQADGSDSRAAREASAQLYETFSRSELAGSSLQGVRCGASLCRIEVRHQDAAAKARFVDGFPTAVPWPTTGLIRFVDEHASVVYLATPEA